MFSFRFDFLFKGILKTDSRYRSIMIMNSQKRINYPEQMDNRKTKNSESSSSDSSSQVSPASDFSEYISSKYIKHSLFEMNKRSFETITTTTSSGQKIVIKYLNPVNKRAYLMQLYNKKQTRDTLIDLVKYYNRNGRMYNNRYWTFINLTLSKCMNSLVKKLNKDDVYNIHKNKYNNVKLVKLASLVRNKQNNTEKVKIDLYNNIVKYYNKITEYENPFSILKIEEGEIDNVSVAEEALDDVPISFNRIRINKRYLENMNVLNSVNVVYRETVVPVRDPNLLEKLIIIIKNFVDSRRKKEFREEIEMEPVGASKFVDIPLDNIQPEMMEPQPTTQQQEAGPVVLNALEQDSSEIPAQIVDDSFWVKNSTSDAIVDHKHASSMEILMHRFEWKNSQNSGYEIFSLDLPSDAIINNMNHPAAMMFGQYAYWNGDMKVRIHINTTPFHVGKLIISWYYSQHYDSNAKDRGNIASAIQLPHVCYSASEGGDVIMTIPYRNYRSMICTRQKTDDSLSFYLGTLSCRVFNPLVIGVETAVDGYVHISFLNSSFTGICPRREIQAEMMPTKSLVKTAEGVLHTIDRVVNMDKPSNPAVPIMYTPQFTDSFATGTNDVSNVHPLKLDPLGVTQHPPGSTQQNSDTKLLNVARRWGLLRTLTWKNSFNQTYNMFTLPVSPELPFSEYFHVYVKNSDKKDVLASVLPPISALCCINAYNRGSLEIKIEIINSRYHVGALLASFTPVLSNVTFAEAVQSYNATFDVGNISEYIFKIPYINERPYNPRFNRLDVGSHAMKLAPTGVFNLYVLNQLKCIAGTSDHIYINLYLRAGDDFEFAVPVSPLYSINIDKDRTVPDQYITPSALTMPGLATWRYASSIVDRMCVMKYNTPDDSILQFSNMKPFVVYKRSWDSDVKLDSVFKTSYYVKRTAEFVINAADVDNAWDYVAMIIVNDDGNKYTYATAFYDEKVATSYVKAHASLVTSTNQYPNSPSIEQWAAYDLTQPIFYLAIRKGADDSYRSFNTTDSSKIKYIKHYQVSLAQAEMDIMSDPTTSSLASTLNGMRMFGESFSDIKDYCRRYQLYATPSIAAQKDTMGTLLRIPLSYLGTSCSSVTNGLVRGRTREGIIPYLLSAFRFARGGMRMKIVITGKTAKSANRDDEVYYIQHRPDVMPSGRDVSKYPLIASSDPSRLLQSGYAYTAFSSVVNNVITIEIPCYIPTNMLMLQSPDYSRLSEVQHYFLGVLDVYIPLVESGAQYTVSVHYAMSDDFHASDFVGFPPMIPLFDVEESDFIKIQPEMEAAKPSVSSKSVEPKAVVTPVPSPVKSEGIFSTVKDKIKNVMGGYTMEATRESLGLPIVDKKDDSIGQIIKDAILKFGEDHQHTITSVVSQIVHCIMNPTVGTFVVAAITILTHLGLNCYHYLQDFMKWFGRLFSDKKTVQPEMDADDNKGERSSEEAKTSFISSLVEMSASTFGKSKDFVKSLSMPNFCGPMFTNVRFGAMTINAIVTMVKNLLDVVPKIMAWLGKKLNPRNWLRWFMSDNKDFIQRWMSDVEYVTDPNNLSKVRSDMGMVYHCELLVMVGRDINVKISSLKDKDFNMNYFNGLIRKLDSVYQDIAANNLTAGSIGIEPFCICIQGKSQVGKTYITKAVSAAMLKSIGFVTNEALFYTRPPGTKHWDGVERQPVCIYDDFGHVTLPEAVTEVIGEFLLLKSKATFAPPRAAVEDKGKKYNPLIIAMTMNESHPKFEGLAAQDAWQNRRDILINCAMKPNYKDKRAQDIPEEVLDVYGHVNFSVYRHTSAGESNDIKEKLPISVPNEATIKNEDESTYVFEMLEVVNYDQITWYLCKEFKIKYEKMKREFLKDLKLQMDFLPAKEATFEENAESYRKYLLENRRYLNDRENRTIKTAEIYFKRQPCEGCKQVVCVCDAEMMRLSKVGTLNIQPEAPAPYTYRGVIKRILDIKPALTVREHDKISRLNLNSSIVKKFMDKPCIHLYACMMEGDCELVIDKSVEDKFIIVSHFTEQDWMLEDTDCFCGGFPENKWKPAYTLMSFSCAGFRDKFIMQARDDKTMKSSVTYLIRKEQNKREFLKWLDQKVPKTTWLGKIGSLLCKILRPIVHVLSVVAIAYGIRAGLSVIYQGGACIVDRIQKRREQNELYSKMIANHEVTDKCLSRGCNICAVGEMAYSDKIVTVQKKRVNIAPKVQGEMSMTTYQKMDTKLRRNFFFLCATEPGMEPIYCRCLGLQGQWFLAVDHYFHKIQAMPLTTTLEYVTAGVRQTIYMDTIKILKIKDSALILGKLPLQIPAFADIVGLFTSERIIPNVPKDSLLYVCDIPSVDKCVNSYTVSVFNETVTLHDDTLHVPHIVDSSMPSTTVQTYFQYSKSGQGLCGSVLMTEMNIPGPIMGIHIAGAKGGGCGYSEVICRETLEALIQQHTNLIVDVEIEGQMFNGKYIKLNTDPHAIRSALVGEYDFIGCTPNKFAYNPPIRSKCVHSLTYNQITTSTYDVPHLYHKDPRYEGSPMFNGCQHHVNPVETFKEQELDIIVEDIENLVLAKVRPLRQKVGVLSISEAVCGIPSIPDYDAMEFNTSEGFPFSTIRPKEHKDKRWLFDLEETPLGLELLSLNSILIDVLDRKYEQRKNGVVPLTVFTDCLKDMKLPKEKCHKTRIFSISPVDFTIQFRQYFYDFTIAFKTARFDVESAIGINVDSYEWHNMVQKLIENSRDFVCGDYSKFGPRLMTLCVMKFFKIIIDWYKFNGDTSFENERIRWIMAHEIAFSCHLMLNMIYRVYSGAPSGSPLTTVLNNGVNMMYIRMAYYNLVCKRKDLTMDDIFSKFGLSYFSKFVSVIFYGDDLIMTVHPDILTYFNANTISIYLSKFDIVFTDALKTGEFSRSLTIFDRATSFLKRNINRHPYRPIYVASMDKRAIEETCNWVFFGHSEPEASILACEAMLLNAHGHGPEYYEDLRKRVMMFWMRKCHVPRIPSWIEVDDRIYGE